MNIQQCLPKSSNCVIIPVYNDPDNLLTLLTEIANYYKGENTFVIIDGDTTGRCSDIANYFDCQVNTSSTKRGYGKAIITGLRMAHAAGYEFATVMDLGTCNPAYSYYYRNADITCRNRQPTFINGRVILSVVAAIFTSIATLSIVKDATHGYRTYKLDTIVPLLDNVTTNGHTTNMEILSLAILQKLNIRWMAVPYVLDRNSELQKTDLKESIRCTIRTLKSRLSML